MQSNDAPPTGVSATGLFRTYLGSCSDDGDCDNQQGDDIDQSDVDENHVEDDESE